MRYLWVGSFLVAVLILQAFTESKAAVTIGEAAPAFTLKDGKGVEHSLSDYKGKYVVLEWVNYDCPFVGKHYMSGNMQRLQRAYTEKGIVWLSVCSSAPGKQGYFEQPELGKRMERVKAAPTAYLVDSKGKVGRMYEARTTPHMFLIDPEGILLYAGGIDDIPSTNVDDVPRATNYIKSALDAVLEGKDVSVSSSKPYGCSVKY